MKLPFVVVALPMFAMSVISAAWAELAPAGYVVSVILAGEDATAKTAVVREGKELPPKLMMPVYSGDVVFVRDPASRVSLELGGGETVEIGGTLARYNVSGEIPTGDDAWSVLTAIGGVLAGEEDTIPENMVSKGDGLAVPLAVRGYNSIVKGNRNLWLAWQGGTAPFSISAKYGENEGIIRINSTAEREIEVPVSFDGGNDHTIGIRVIVVRDARQQVAVLPFRLRDSLPVFPNGLKKSFPGRSASTLVRAAWLASLDKGAWTLEAAQLLHTQAKTDQAAAALLARMVKGWKPE